MAANPSFDIVSEVNLEEVQNAVNQSMVEIRQRFDFKNSKSDVTLDKGAHQMVLVSDDEVKMQSVIEVLQSKLARRQVSLKALEYGKIELASGGAVRQTVNIQQGIPQLKGKEIAKFIRGIGAKVQSQIMDTQIRVTGKKKDDLQTVMTSLRAKDFGIDISFTNYR
ncbi:MAG: YajQ family cyclic di-GMP-binding protein [Candidatus Tectomicrobia bacterium]